MNNNPIKNLGKYAKRGNVPWNKGILGKYSVNARENNPMWGGNKIVRATGQSRARRWFAKRYCEICGNQRSEIHHKDGDDLNNKKGNIVFLCRKHHMEIDGRLESLKNFNLGKHQTNNGGWKICTVCNQKFRSKKAFFICKKCIYQEELSCR